jgi:hypothetical protein
MRRIGTRSIIASLLDTSSFVRRRRYGVNQANVRSTFQRLGSTWKPRWCGARHPRSTSQPMVRANQAVNGCV